VLSAEAVEELARRADLPEGRRRLPAQRVWFVGAAVVWNLVLGPLLALADRGLQPLHRLRVRGVRALNVVRVPALLSALLLLVWAPLVLRRFEGVYEAKSALQIEPYLGRWAGVTVALVAGSPGRRVAGSPGRRVAGSAVAYGVAVLRAARAGR